MFTYTTQTVYNDYEVFTGTQTRQYDTESSCIPFKPYVCSTEASINISSVLYTMNHKLNC